MLGQGAEVGIPTSVTGWFRSRCDRLGTRVLIATEGELVEKLPNREVEVFAGGGSASDAREGLGSIGRAAAGGPRANLTGFAGALPSR